VIDLDAVRAGITSFWETWGDLIISVVGLLLIAAFALVIRYALRHARSTPRSRLIAGYVFALSLFWMGEGQFEVMTRPESGFEVPWGVALFACGIFEGFLAQAYYQAEEYRREYGHPGPAGPRMWFIGLAGAAVAASAAASVTEYLFRLVVPVMAVWGIWTILRAPRADDSAAVKARRQEQEDRRRATWAWTPRSILVAVGAMRPEAISTTAAEEERQVRKLAALGDLIAAAPASNWHWLRDRRERKLRKLTRTATAGQLAEAAARVARARRAADIIAHGEPIEPEPELVPWTGQPRTPDPRTMARVAQALQDVARNGSRTPAQDAQDAPRKRVAQSAPRRPRTPRTGAQSGRADDRAERVAMAVARVRIGGAHIRAAAREFDVPESTVRAAFQRAVRATKES
jgi:hypothetical protein